MNGFFCFVVKEKHPVVGADFAVIPLKEAVCAHLRQKGGMITVLGVTDPTVEVSEKMFCRMGWRVVLRAAVNEI